MALNGSGPISFGGSTTGQSINLELGLSATATISLNDAAVRELAGVATGAITVPTDFYGKAVSTPRGIVGGGATISGVSVTNAISYFSLESTGNATDFGDLSSVTVYGNALANATRAVFTGGTGSDFSTSSNSMVYVTIMSTGNATDFGDLLTGNFFHATAANDTRGVIMGGYSSFFSSLNTIQYITTATTGDASDFGDLAQARASYGSVASTTRGIIFQGYTNLQVNTISYITIASTGNDTDFGDGFDTDTVWAGGASNSTRGVFAGGGINSSNIIQYITIATTGNSQDFGDLTGLPYSSEVSYMTAVANSTQVVFCGALDGDNASSNVMQYVTIASTGNGTDWGDLPLSVFSAAGTSNVHGGLS